MNITRVMQYENIPLVCLVVYHMILKKAFGH